MKKFTEYLKEQGIELLPWQEQATIDFLKNVEQNQGAASGKAFVVKMLFDFIQTHGNCFELDISNNKITSGDRQTESDQSAGSLSKWIERFETASNYALKTGETESFDTILCLNREETLEIIELLKQNK